jgi:hypothetical protein
MEGSVLFMKYPEITSIGHAWPNQTAPRTRQSKDQLIAIQITGRLRLKGLGF